MKTNYQPDQILKMSQKELKKLTFNNEKALIFDYQRFTLNDGPGIRTMIYFKGCPLRCPWCHNPESLEFNIEISKDKKEVYGFYETPANVVEYCLKDVDYYKKSGGGVTFTGGEAIMQVNHLITIAKSLKKHDIHIALETSGYADIEEYRKLLPYIDLLLIDHKATEEQYSWKIRGNFTNMMKLHREANLQNIEVWLRLPVIPGENDTKERFDGAIALTKLYDNISYVDILPYHPLGISKAEKVGKLQMAKRFEEPSNDKVNEWIDYFRKNGVLKARRG